jgi:hypothetical protein
MWCCRRTEKINLIDNVKSEVLYRVKEERTVVHIQEYSAYRDKEEKIILPIEARRRRISRTYSQGVEEYPAYRVKGEKNILHIESSRRRISCI